MTEILSSLFPPILILAVVLIVVGIWRVGEQRERERQAAYAAYAADHNFQYVAVRDGAESQYQAFMPLFRSGSMHRWRYEMAGKIGGCDFAAFEYRYTISTGRSSATFSEAMIKWEDPGSRLPEFLLGPESLFNRIGQALFGMEDVDFPDDPAFSRAYVLKGDEMEVAALFTPEIRAYLVAHPYQHLAGSEHVLFWWWTQALPPPSQLDGFLAAGIEIRKLFLPGDG